MEFSLLRISFRCFPALEWDLFTLSLSTVHQKVMQRNLLTTIMISELLIYHWFWILERAILTTRWENPVCIRPFFTKKVYMQIFSTVPVPDCFFKNQYVGKEYYYRYSESMKIRIWILFSVFFLYLRKYLIRSTVRHMILVAIQVPKKEQQFICNCHTHVPVPFTQ